jgi:hypothetical protein
MKQRHTILHLLTVVLAATMIAPAVAADKAPANGDKSLAELPKWPVGFKLNPETYKGWKHEKKMKARPKAHVLVWTPPKVKKVRAVFLIPNNTDSKHVGEHDAVRKIAGKHQIGIVYLRNFDGSVVERTNPPQDANNVFADVLKQVAEHTGIETYRYAPWITFGKSSRGRFPFRTTWWFPKRVISSISYHAETPSWPMKDWSKVKDESVLHLAINGQDEWSGTWYRHVRPSLLNYHHNTDWLAHQVVLHGVGHGNYVNAHGSKGWGEPVPKGKISVLSVWDYIALHIDKAMELRVPKNTYATAEKPVKLKQVDRSKGILIHPRAPEELLGMKWMAFRLKDKKYQIIPWPDEKHPVLDTTQGSIDKKLLMQYAGDVPEDKRADYLWVADHEQATAWLKLHNIQDMENVLPKKKDAADKAGSKD